MVIIIFGTDNQLVYQTIMYAVILQNFSENASLIISTHIIADIERILDEVIFIDNGKVVLHSAADALRETEGGSIDDIFRRRFKCRKNCFDMILNG